MSSDSALQLVDDVTTETTVADDESLEALLGILEAKECKEAEQLQEPVCGVLQNDEWKKHEWITLVACRGGFDALLDHCLLQPVRQHMHCGALSISLLCIFHEVCRLILCCCVGSASLRKAHIYGPVAEAGTLGLASFIIGTRYSDHWR